MLERLRRLLETHEAVIEATDYGADVTLEVLVREDMAEAFAEALRELSAGGLVPEDTGEKFCGVRI
jgi:putative IMPACT (imprinted ancient) family translation regulator